MELVLERQDAASTGARSKLYARLAYGFRYPTASLVEAVKSGQFLSEMKAVASELPYPFAVDGTLGSGVSWDLQQFENQYIWLFDVGGPNPNTGEWEAPCFLCEGEHGGGRLKVMQDALRFYHHFGLSLSQEKGERDRPDHLSAELEFLHALTFKEAELWQQGKGKEALRPYREAERDFLLFHLADFLPQVAGKVVHRNISFYSDLARLGERFCQAELACLQRGT
jgi:putative dimethyl sulfoxide reductase chaperone